MTQPLALIIEDDEKLAAIFAEALKRAEFEIEIAQDGKVALAKLSDLIPDLVVLDLHLPEVSGKDILYRIRGDSRLAETRIMITTADPALADGLREDADLALVKPISFSQLYSLASRLRPPDIIGID